MPVPVLVTRAKAESVVGRMPVMAEGTAAVNLSGVLVVLAKLMVDPVPGVPGQAPVLGAT